MEEEIKSEIIDKLANIEQKLDSMEGRISTLEGVKHPEALATVAVPVPEEDDADMELIRNKAVEANPPTATEEPAKKRDFETELGQKWFSRLGIVALVIGISLFLIYSLQYFSAFGKVSLGFLSAAALIGVGYWLEKKYRLFGQILLGGGVALAYFTSYAMYYFDATKLIDSQYADISILLSIALGYFVYIFIKYREEKMTLIPLTLVFLTVNLGELARFSLVMVTIFMMAALAIFWVSKWKYGYVFTMVAAYLTYFRWLVPGMGSGPADMGTLIFSLGILTTFYLFFVLSHYFFYREEDTLSKVENIGLVTVNSAVYYGLFSVIIGGSYDVSNGLLLLLFAILNITLACIIRFIVGAHYMSRVYMTFGVLFLFFWIPSALTGFTVVISWLLLAFAFALYGVFKGTIRTRLVGMAIFFYTFLYMMGTFPGETDKITVGALALLYFVICEGISLLQQRYQLNTEPGDIPQNETGMSALYSVFSVVALAIGLLKIFDYNYISLVWGVAGFLVPVLGFVVKDRYFRRAGLCLLLLVFIKLFLFDLGSMEMIFRIISFIALGAILLVLSFGYTKYKEEIKRYL